MTFIEISLIAVGLSMDAFAVAVASGATMKHLDLPNALKMGLFFGGCHTLMPILGWLIGLEMRNYITGWDHWVAFGLLSFLGGNMIYESFHSDAPTQAKPSLLDNYGKPSDRSARILRHASYPSFACAPGRRADVHGGFRQDPPSIFDTKSLGLMSIATSVDAMAVGLTFSMLTVAIGGPAILIGLVVFSLSVFGVALGSRAGHLLGNNIEILGGLILIGIGLRILFEHIG